MRWQVLKTRGEPQMTDEPLESQQGLKKQRILIFNTKMGNYCEYFRFFESL